jgi:competence protein ComGC
MVPTVRAEAPLAEQLPPGSLLYVGWAGRNLPFDGSNMGRLLQEPAVGHMLGALKKSIDKMPEKSLADLWAIGGIMWQHPVAFSLMDLAPGNGEAPGVSMVLLIDLGKDRAAFAKHLDAIILSGKLKMSPATIGQVACRTMPTPLGAVTLGYKGNTFFLALGDQTARKLLSVKPTLSLKTDKAFIARRKGVAGDNEQFAYSVDLAKLGPKVSSLFNQVAGGRNGSAKPPAADKVKQIVDALGLGKITSASGSTRIVDKGLHSKSRILTPAPHRGVLTLLSGGALSDADLSGAPDDAILFCASKFSAAAFYAEVLNVAKRIEPGADKEIRKEVAKIENELGVSFSKDILGNLGDTWTLTSASSLGGFGSGTVLTISVKDAAKLSAAIGKIETFFRKKTTPPPSVSGRRRRRRGPSLEVLKSGKLEVHYIQGIDRDAPVAPAWAISKGKLYVGLWPQVVVAAVENNGSKPLIRKAAFLKLRKRMSAKPATLTYIDTPAIVRSFYNLLLLGWTVGSAELPRELGLDIRPKVDWLPSLSKIEKYLSPEMAAVSSDAAGITIESYGSLPIVSNYMTSILTTAPVGAAVIVPAVFRAKDQAAQTSSRARLKMIGNAVAMYQTDTGQSPPGLVTLVEKRFISAHSLVSPVSGRRMPTDSKGLPIGKSDYVYIVHSAKAAGNLVRAYELPENYGKRGTNVLLVSGAVMWVDTLTLKRMLAKSTAPPQIRK